MIVKNDFPIDSIREKSVRGATPPYVPIITKNRLHDAYVKKKKVFLAFI